MPWTGSGGVPHDFPMRKKQNLGLGTEFNLHMFLGFRLEYSILNSLYSCDFSTELPL